MNPTSKPLTLEIGGEPRTLYFDLNTFTAFEDVSGKFFLDFLASVQETLVAVQSAAIAAGKDADKTDALQILRHVALKDVQSFLWAAMHTYDQKGEPVWPKTRGQVGRLIDVNNIGMILPALMNASAGNLPDAEPEKSDVRPIVPEVPSLPLARGGSESGPSDAEILGSLTPILEG